MSNYISTSTLRPILEAVFGAIKTTGASPSSPSIFKGVIPYTELSKDKALETFKDGAIGIWAVSYPRDIAGTRVIEKMGITEEMIRENPTYETYKDVYSSDFAGILIGVGWSQYMVTQLLIGSCCLKDNEFVIFFEIDSPPEGMSDIAAYTRTLQMPMTIGEETEPGVAGDWAECPLYDSAANKMTLGSGGVSEEDLAAIERRIDEKLDSQPMLKVREMTKAQYDALTPDPDTLYLITAL
ncbi:MAG: hypothetical protein NC039_09070 [Muribaculaceae bacterium]|nr:hypothetical protein [Muribaculaceae bacterium]